MSIFDVLALFGGLALFLFGMNVMGDGLTRAAGGKMERILEKLTSTPIKGVLLGAAVTAVIQSSSATTVMVVGFVNSGIMKLRQAVGIIMGANIGTTVTSWILSLSGIQGDSIWIQMLKPSSFSPILAVIGIAFLMFSKNEKKHDIGMIFCLTFDLSTRFEIPVQHALTMQFKNPALSKTTSYCPSHGFRIRSTCLCQQHGFCNNSNRSSDNQLIAQFCNLSASCRADQSRTPHDFKYRSCTLEIFFRSPHHDGECSGFSTNNASGNRSIQKSYPSRFQHLPDFPGFRLFCRTHIDEQGTFPKNGRH